MQNIHNQITNNIKKIDFKKLWKDFEAVAFALYNSEQVYFEKEVIPYDQRFIGNTTIKYNDNQIAIWNLPNTENVDIDILTSKIIHEMFHAYQMINSEKRWPNEYHALDYSYSVDNLTQKYAETSILIEAYKNQSYKHFLEFIKMRQTRQHRFPEEVIYEQKIETVEGMANFIELQALKQLDNQKYTSELDKIINSLTKEESYIPIRMLSYHIGVLIMETAHLLGLDLDHNISNNKTPLVQLLDLPITENFDGHQSTTFDYAKIEGYKKNIEKSISNVLLHFSSETTFTEIKGLDPLNTFKIDDKIYFKHFVMYEITGEIKFIMGSSVANLNTNKIYTL